MPYGRQEPAADQVDGLAELVQRLHRLLGARHQLLHIALAKPGNRSLVRQHHGEALGIDGVNRQGSVHCRFGQARNFVLETAPPGELIDSLDPAESAIAIEADRIEFPLGMIHGTVLAAQMALRTL